MWEVKPHLEALENGMTYADRKAKQYLGIRHVGIDAVTVDIPVTATSAEADEFKSHLAKPFLCSWPKEQGQNKKYCLKQLNTRALDNVAINNQSKVFLR